MSSLPLPSSLDDWLQYIARVHYQEIELGLKRIGAVAERLALGKLAPTVITVAGTNGKGTTVHGLEAVLAATGARVASYTSPHLQRFNERIRINLKEASDQQLCDAFTRIEQARGETSLSYFEYASLAAFLLFSEVDLDYVILEVGLGGRLDAVNLIDPDLTIISSIALDHQQWLGNDREAIGAEKAGILRPGKPLLYGEADMPGSIRQRAAALGCPLWQYAVDFSMLPAGGAALQYRGQGSDCSLSGLAIPASSGALVLAACELLEVPLAAAATELARLQVAGRFEARVIPGGGPHLVVDVAHNPAAAALLARRLRSLREGELPGRRVACLLAVLADKDVEGIVSSLVDDIDIWYIAQVEDGRALSAEKLLQRGETLFKDCAVGGSYHSVLAGLDAARAELTADDLIVVAGSFLTVAAVRAVTEPISKADE